MDAYCFTKGGLIMKARVKATGEIVEVFPYNKDGFAYIHEDGETVYEAIELEVYEYDSDYWTRLEHQYAGMAMQGILSNANHALWDRENNAEGIAKSASTIAHALVEKYKKEEK